MQLSQIQTDKLLAHAVGVELEKRKQAGTYKGKYAPLCHYFGYQARSAMPSNFDATLANALGCATVSLVAAGGNGLMANARRVAGPVSEWKLEGIPLTELLAVSRSARGDVVCQLPSCKVKMEGGAMQLLNTLRSQWEVHGTYRNPGPYPNPKPNWMGGPRDLSEPGSGPVQRIRLE